MTNQKVVVVGAGLMGLGIAHAFAVAGLPVLLIDNSATALKNAVKRIGDLLEEGVKRGKLNRQDAAAALAQITTASVLDQRGADAALFIETVVEDIAVKQSVLQQAVTLLPVEAVLATNTSALSITEIASVIPDPGRLIGMHFFNPVTKSKLVELIRGLETSQLTVDRAIAWVSRLGKDHIVANEAPGFTTSRMSAIMGNEAMYMLAEGVASAEDIDKSLRMAFNHPMGPLELGDLTGWDTRLRVLQYLHVMLGEKFRPCPLIIKMVNAGRHGRKAGQGVYDYDAAGVRIAGSGLKPA